MAKKTKSTLTKTQTEPDASYDDIAEQLSAAPPSPDELPSATIAGPGSGVGVLGGLPGGGGIGILPTDYDDLDTLLEGDTLPDPEAAAEWLKTTTKQSQQAIEWMETHPAALLDAEGAPLQLAEVFAANANALPEGMSLETFESAYEAFSDGTGLPEFKADINNALADWVAAKGNPDLDMGEKYDALGEYATKVRDVLKEQGFDTDHKPSSQSSHPLFAEWDALRGETKAWLEGLDPDELRQVAHHGDVTYPILLSGGHELTAIGDQNSLAAILDPAYSEHSGHKKFMQSTALKRFAQLQSGEISSYKGITLADVLADEAAKGTPAPSFTFGTEQPWQATAGDLAQMAESLPSTAGLMKSDAVEAVVAHNAKLAAATPGPGVTQADIEAAYATFDHAHYFTPPDAEKLASLTGIDAETFQFATKNELTKLLDPTVTPETLQAIKAAAAGAKTTQAASIAAKDQLQSLMSETAATPATVAQVVKAQNVLVSNIEATPASAYPEAGLPSAVSPTDLHAWMKDQPLATLREAAGDLGMGELSKAASKSTRADVQNFLVAHAHGQEHAKNVVLTKVEGKLETAKAAAAAATSAPPVAAPAEAAPAPQPKPAAAPSVASPMVTSPKAVGGKVKMAPVNAAKGQVFDLLNQQLATHSDIPAFDNNALASASLTPGGSAPTGGSHTTTAFKDSSGQQWFGKGYGASGATPRVEAEAVAAHAKSMAGLSTIPVYHHKHGGTSYAVQPVVAGVKPLSDAAVSTFSQADIDTVVSHQVGDFLIGDHDGNPSNWLRTPSGGLTRCDLGQAFKFWGADQADIDWNPNGNYGTPVFKQVVTSAKNGSLPKGTQVDPGAALAPIMQLESIPDQQWRDTVRPVAEAGVKNPDGVAWYDRMRKRAAASQKVPVNQVTKEQVVEAFCDHAVERKQNIRQTFVDLFKSNGFDTSALEDIF